MYLAKKSNTKQKDSNEKSPKAKANKPAPTGAKAKVAKFTNRLFIPGYRLVEIGVKVTLEAKKAWESWTEVPISNYSK